MSVNEAKVVFLGRAAVGKTSIIEHYCRKTFSEFQEPTITRAQTSVVKLNETTTSMDQT